MLRSLFSIIFQPIVIQLLNDLDDTPSVYDFRVVNGTNQINLIFDVVVPYDFKIEHQILIDTISHKIKAIDEKFAVVI